MPGAIRYVEKEIIRMLQQDSPDIVEIEHGKFVYKCLHPLRWRIPQKLWLAGQTSGLLFILPLLLRILPLPTLLGVFARPDQQFSRRDATGIEESVRIVLRICQLPVFRLTIFPQNCLRQSLALYYILNSRGYSVEIHFGVLKEGKDLQGHSWITVLGRKIGERWGPERFKSVYSYPSR